MLCFVFCGVCVLFWVVCVFLGGVCFLGGVVFLCVVCVFCGVLFLTLRSLLRGLSFCVPLSPACSTLAQRMRGSDLAFARATNPNLPVKEGHWQLHEILRSAKEPAEASPQSLTVPNCEPSNKVRSDNLQQVSGPGRSAMRTASQAILGSGCVCLLCCVVLCCTLLCVVVRCFVLCCVVLCCVVHGCAWLCCDVVWRLIGDTEVF